jgi:hypothetical protein
MTKPANFPAIETTELRIVVGGLAAPMPNMGAPKYSAAWWDIVRARGLEK